MVVVVIRRLHPGRLHPGSRHPGRRHLARQRRRRRRACRIARCPATEPLTHAAGRPERARRTRRRWHRRATQRNAPYPEDTRGRRRAFDWGTVAVEVAEHLGAPHHRSIEVHDVVGVVKRRARRPPDEVRQARIDEIGTHGRRGSPGPGRPRTAEPCRGTIRCGSGCRRSGWSIPRGELHDDRAAGRPTGSSVHRTRCGLSPSPPPAPGTRCAPSKAPEHLDTRCAERCRERRFEIGRDRIAHPQHPVECPWRRRRRECVGRSGRFGGDRRHPRSRCCRSGSEGATVRSTVTAGSGGSSTTGRGAVAHRHRGEFERRRLPGRTVR